MRYCLECRRLSADGPLCTSCGRSFGGRLCNHKKGRHLNPPDANVCGQCGSTTLADAAGYLPFSWMSRLLFWIGLLLVARLVVPPMLHWGGDVLGITRYRDPRVWLIETCARVLLPFGTVFLVFYSLSFIIPGEPGKLMRDLMLMTVRWSVQTFLKMVQAIGVGLVKLLMGWMQGSKVKQ